MFLEKIFIFLWFWHLTVGIITLVSFFHWFARMGFPKRRINFVRKYLKIMCVMRETDKATTRKFVENYLRPDGVFILRLISINVGDFIAGDLACELWHIYRHKRLQNMEDIKLMEGEYLQSSLRGPLTKPQVVSSPTGMVAGGHNTNNFSNDDSIV
ncbi:Innexin inx2 [Cichlidogyrus casuarinus]|uniref:Innexin n=1 Tax=Cichlidogyrus casuarinus TaxID=1844966 RepID=A0ABD2PVG2_9PLAT